MKIFVRRITLLHWSGIPVKEANHQDQKRFSCGVLNNKFIMLKVGNRNWVGQAARQCLSQGGGLDKPTDRNQWSWIFLKDPKKCFTTNRPPPPPQTTKLSEKQNPKKYPKITVHFAKLKHHVIIMLTHDY